MLILQPVAYPEKSRLGLCSKGKGAFSTENRRFTWDFVVWPMLLQLNRPYFTLEEFRIRRTEICRKYRIKSSNIRGGLYH